MAECNFELREVKGSRYLCSHHWLTVGTNRSPSCPNRKYQVHPDYFFPVCLFSLTSQNIRLEIQAPDRHSRPNWKSYTGDRRPVSWTNITTAEYLTRFLREHWPWSWESFAALQTQCSDLPCRTESRKSRSCICGYQKGCPQCSDQVS